MRYSAEYRKMAKNENRPLFTIDLDERHLGKTHTNITGVLGDDGDTYLIAKLKHMLAIAEGKIQP